MFCVILLGIAAGLASAMPSSRVDSQMSCPCMASSGAATATAAYGASWAAPGTAGVSMGSWGASTATWAAPGTSSASMGSWGASTATWAAPGTAGISMGSWGASTATWAAPETTNPSITGGAIPTSCGAPATTASAAGMTHTVIVAPTQGILRYVPFVLNATVGDTVNFVWNANNHTVTKSSQLAICNKTIDSPFASGEQSKSFVFQQTINATDSTYFYCGTPGHCPKGMFGIINPPNAATGSNMSLASMMPAMAANSSSMAAMWQYTQMMTQNNTMAANWGGSIDMSGMPQWAQQYVAENVMYTRTFLAANPETLNADGSVSLANAGNSPLQVPIDITSIHNNASSQTGSSGSSPSSSMGTSSSGSSNNPSPTATSGARQLLGFSGIISTFTMVVTLAFLL
ncbi:hypothetical protein SCLCIDRAFT_1218389 [Scleroderma citrinum Foug A]|uniref:Phytocyanin domain-containing protein n=1 Tax=Scleroderma citrinum Foug A TaxID=1036808 RepID=A0A0C3DR67_9AGAM|nr:hypothetical protein SCLCIDRAFT_1218389 [Scleroderma citrinum Foug A]